MKICFTAKLEKFGANGDKTGWTYFIISETISNKLKPGVRNGFRVKGTLDDFEIKQVSLLPVKAGKYMMPFNAAMRKATGKKAGDKISVEIEADDSEKKLSEDFLLCLADDPDAQQYFDSLPKSHQHYYSKWIEDAKTEPTKTKRIAIVVNGLARHMDYGAMLREQRDQKLTR